MSGPDAIDDDWRDFGDEPPAYDIEALTGHIGPICGEWLKDDSFGWVCCVRRVGTCETPDGRYHSSDYGMGWMDGVETDAGEKMQTRPGPVGGVPLPPVADA